MIKPLSAAILFISALVTMPADARVRPVPSISDPHFQSVPYTNEIIEIVIRPGRFVEIQLAPNETDIKFGMGDRDAWTVKTTDNIFAFKAKAPMADTNLKIWSPHSKRVYWFNITMAKDKKTLDLWHLDIVYPPDPPKPPPAPIQLPAPDPQVVAIQLAEKERADVEDRLAVPAAAPAFNEAEMPTLNGNYGIIGPAELTPTSVYDNGEQTVMTFAPNHPMPTIFVKERDGSETRVSKHVENDMLIVHRVAQKFVLRHNGEAACLINGSFNQAGITNRTKTVSRAVVRELKKED